FGPPWDDPRMGYPGRANRPQFVPVAAPDCIVPVLHLPQADPPGPPGTGILASDIAAGRPRAAPLLGGGKSRKNPRELERSAVPMTLTLDDGQGRWVSGGSGQ